MTNSQTLKEILSKRIVKQGRITFAEYMAACLYEPGLGYYTSPGRKVGTEGDFYTSISVHAAFGRVIAREIAQMWRIMEKPDSFTLVECGAGHGRLACDIMDYLAQREPDFYRIITLVLIEKEPTLEAAQRELLKAHAGKLAWLSPETLATGQFSFSGCLYSNELLDALPVHRVIMTEAGLKEIFVTVNDDEFAEVTAEPSTPALAEYLDTLGITLHPGKEAEINLAATGWLLSAATALQHGFILTIDYGYPAEELFAPHRRRGTLLCYHRHQIEENPYIRLGEQDITSHVDFTTLIRQGERFGLKPEWFGEQYRFLLSTGILDEINEMEGSDASGEEKLRLRLALKRLIMPEGGMGDTFRILIQSKQLAADAPLLCKRRIGG
jgi:SAM-dependent MidA family methyltransferase